jgi:hypothetical protein
MAAGVSTQDVRPLTKSVPGEIAVAMSWSQPHTLGVLAGWKSASVYCESVLRDDHCIALDGGIAEPSRRKRGDGGKAAGYHRFSRQPISTKAPGQGPPRLPDWQSRTPRGLSSRRREYVSGVAERTSVAQNITARVHRVPAPVNTEHTLRGELPMQATIAGVWMLGIIVAVWVAGRAVAAAREAYAQGLLKGMQDAVQELSGVPASYDDEGRPTPERFAKYRQRSGGRIYFRLRSPPVIPPLRQVIAVSIR